MAISTFPAPSAAGGAAKEKRVEFFTATGSWTAPAGVTHAIAHVVSGGGGGGGSQQRDGQTGGSSSAFGTSRPGGRGGHSKFNTAPSSGGISGLANSGNGGSAERAVDTSVGINTGCGADSILAMFGATVDPGDSYTITIGAGGGNNASGGGLGGSGFVSIEYYVEA